MFATICKISFILSLWIKTFLFEFNFRKCSKALSWWNVETKLKFASEIVVFCLLSSLLHNLTENMVYHIGILNIVFFKTSAMFLILKTLFPRPFVLEQMIFTSHLSPLGNGHRSILCFIQKRACDTHIATCCFFLLYPTLSRSFLTLLAQ